MPSPDAVLSSGWGRNKLGFEPKSARLALGFSGQSECLVSDKLLSFSDFLQLVAMGKHSGREHEHKKRKKKKHSGKKRHRHLTDSSEEEDHRKRKRHKERQHYREESDSEPLTNEETLARLRQLAQQYNTENNKKKKKAVATAGRVMAP